MKTIKMLFGLGIGIISFASGVIFERKRVEQKTNYSGELVVEVEKGGKDISELYLKLNDEVDFAKTKTVILRVILLKK